MEKTLAIIKPDAVERNLIGQILARVEEKEFKIIALKMKTLTKSEAQGFYLVHEKQPFFNELTSYMSSGPLVLMVLERNNSIKNWRELMGATDPAEANPGTIRKDFALNIERNSTHGSDAPETASFEISYFFDQMEIQG